MRLEEELATNKFTDEAHKAHLNLMFTAAWLRGRFGVFFREFGLTMEQYNVMRIVRGYKGGTPLMVKEISCRMIERNSNTTRIIDRLQQKGLVQRCKQRIDKRVIGIVLTEKGTELMREIDEVMEQRNPHRTAMPEERYSLLNELLEELRLEYERAHGPFDNDTEADAPESDC